MAQDKVLMVSVTKCKNYHCKKAELEFNNMGNMKFSGTSAAFMEIILYSFT